MKLSCDRSTLAGHASVLRAITSSGATLEILGHILLKAESGKLRLSATDLEAFLTIEMKAEVEEEGSVTVPAGTFGDLVSAWTADTVKMKLNEKALKLAMSCSRNRANIKGMDAEEFPLAPILDKEDPIRLKASALQKALSQVVFAASTEQSRLMLCGVLCRFEGKKLTLVAADGFRLGLLEMDLPHEVSEPLQLLIPAQSVRRFLRLKADGQDVLVKADQRRVVFELDDVELASMVIDMQFPDYTQIIPKKHTTELTVDRKELAKALRSVQVFARIAANTIRVKVEGEAEEPKAPLMLSSQSDEAGDVTSYLDATVTGDDIEFALNGRYWMDSVTALEEDKIVMQLSTASSPITIKPDGNENILYVLMPMHITK